MTAKETNVVAVIISTDKLLIQPAKTSSMFPDYLSISLVNVSSAMDHTSKWQMPAGVTPRVYILVATLVSLILSLVQLQFLLPELEFLTALKQFNWASYMLAFSLAGLIKPNWKR